MNRFPAILVFLASALGVFAQQLPSTGWSRDLLRKNSAAEARQYLGFSGTATNAETIAAASTNAALGAITNFVNSETVKTVQTVTNFAQNLVSILSRTNQILTNSTAKIYDTLGSTNIPVVFRSTNKWDNPLGQHITYIAGNHIATSTDGAFGGINQISQLDKFAEAPFLQLIILRVLDANTAIVVSGAQLGGIGKGSYSVTNSTTWRLGPPTVHITDNTVGAEINGMKIDQNGMPWFDALDDTGTVNFYNDFYGTAGSLGLAAENNVGLNTSSVYGPGQGIMAISSCTTNSPFGSGLAGLWQLGVHTGAPSEAFLILPRIYQGIIAIGSGGAGMLGGFTNRHDAYLHCFSDWVMHNGAVITNSQFFALPTTNAGPGQISSYTNIALLGRFMVTNASGGFSGVGVMDMIVRTNGETLHVRQVKSAFEIETVEPIAAEFTNGGWFLEKAQMLTFNRTAGSASTWFDERGVQIKSGSTSAGYLGLYDSQQLTNNWRLEVANFAKFGTIMFRYQGMGSGGSCVPLVMEPTDKSECLRILSSGQVSIPYHLTNTLGATVAFDSWLSPRTFSSGEYTIPSSGLVLATNAPFGQTPTYQRYVFVCRTNTQPGGYDAGDEVSIEGSDVSGSGVALFNTRTVSTNVFLYFRGSPSITGTNGAGIAINRDDWRIKVYLRP